MQSGIEGTLGRLGLAPGRPRRNAGVAAARPRAVARGRGRAGWASALLRRAARSPSRSTRWSLRCVAASACAAARAARCSASAPGFDPRRHRARHAARAAMPLELELALAQAPLRVEATLALAGSTRDTALRFDLQARRSGDLARWLALRRSRACRWPCAAAARRRQCVDARAATLELGRSELPIERAARCADGRPLITASVRSPLIDAQELSTLRAGTPAARCRRAQRAHRSSGASTLADADLDLQLQRLRLGRTELQDVAWSPARTKAACCPSRSRARWRARRSPRGSNSIARRDAVGEPRSVHRRHRHRRAAARAGRRRGHRWRAPTPCSSSCGPRQQPARAGRSTPTSTRACAGGSITVLGAAQRPVAEIGVDQAIIGAAAGEPIRARLDGTIDQKPVRIDLRSGTLCRLRARCRRGCRSPWRRRRRAARLSLEGEVALPLGQRRATGLRDGRGTSRHAERSGARGAAARGARGRCAGRSA